MTTKEVMSDRLLSAVSVYSDVAQKSMFGANGHCRDNKVFCMVTKNAEFAFKIDDATIYHSLIDEGAQAWSPRGSGSFGHWLMLESDCNDEKFAQWVEMAYSHI